MIDLSSFWLFAIPFTVAAAIPGPAQGALVAQVLSRGGAATAAFVAGMVLGNAIWLSAALLGMSTLALRFEFAFVAIKWLGVAYLLFVAWKLWSTPAGVQDSSQAQGGGLLSGVALTLGNPKAVVFFGAVLPHAFDMSALTARDGVVVLALGVLIDLSVQIAYVGVASRVRAFVRSPPRMRIANRSAAALLAGSAALVASRG